MSLEIEWFCYLAVSKKLLTAEQCRRVADALTRAGKESEVMLFAQTVVDNHLCTNVDRLEQFLETAVQLAGTGDQPPESILSGPAATAAAAAPLRGTTGAMLGEDWLTGWPVLQEAEQASPQQAMEMICAFLQRASEAGCSDVHISSGAQPFVRRFKQVYLLDQPVLSPEAAATLNMAILTEPQRQTFEQTHDLDFSYSFRQEERFRCNLMLQRLGVAGSYRVIDSRVKTLRELGFPRPAVIEKLTTYHQGLILITGPAGCGKSTTLNALVDLINNSRQDHIITVEDPIEIVHQPKRCNVTQREVKNHTKSFAAALRAALREDPDIIVIGELRDLETIEMAIRASETGHLVIGTLHTGSASSTMDRVLDVFPPNQQAQIRSMAAESLKGVICQQLVPNKTEDGLVLVAEIMLGTLAVSNIVREGETFKLPSIIQTNYNNGMCTMEQAFFDLYMNDKRTYEQSLTVIKSQELIHQMQVHEAQKAAEAAGLNTKKKGWFG